MIPFEKILIQKKAFDYPVTKEILSRLPGIPFETLEDLSFLKGQGTLVPSASVLLLAVQEGKFFKPCPCTPSHICCRYHFINLATNCTIGCSYCILQGYLNNPFLTIYVNLEDLYGELKEALVPDRFFRMGTGELTDSLLLDPLTSYSLKLAHHLKQYENAVLELKTKTVNIGNLLKFSPERRVIVSWSMNPPLWIQSDERNAATLEERLQAARECVRAGYVTAFHFDPILWFKGWEVEYEKVVNKIFSVIEEKDIAWISLGTLRYPGHMEALFRKNNPGSSIFLAEMFPGTDGKLRYFRPLRERIYRKMVCWIKERAPRVLVYLCMESLPVWKSVFGEEVFKGKALWEKMDDAVMRTRG